MILQPPSLFAVSFCECAQTVVCACFCSRGDVFFFLIFVFLFGRLITIHSELTKILCLCMFLFVFSKLFINHSSLSSLKPKDGYTWMVDSHGNFRINHLFEIYNKFPHPSINVRIGDVISLSVISFFFCFFFAFFLLAFFGACCV